MSRPDDPVRSGLAGAIEGLEPREEEVTCTRSQSFRATEPGPEVTTEAVKVLDAAAKSCGFKYETTHFDFGGDRYLRTGEVLPESVVDELRSSTPSCSAPSATRT